MIYGDIFHQQLKLINSHAISDTINYFEMKFNFKTPDWDGLEKWAHFQKDDLVYDIPLTDDQIREEDHLNLTSGVWKVYLHGNKFEDGTVVKRITTSTATLEVFPTGTLEGEPFQEMPASETERILARLTKLEKNGNVGTAFPEDVVKFVGSQTLRVGENVLTDAMVTLGAGWSGSLATGFTHASGSTEPLTFAVGAADGESYLVDGTDSGYNQAAIALSLGDSPTSEPYNGTPTIQWGLTCVGDNGALKILPAGGYTGKITGLTCRKISGDGETEVEITLGDIRHTDNPNHLTGFWNIAMGENALGNSVNGTRNIAVGKSSLAALKSGGRNIGLGTYTLSQMEKGENNIAIGADAGLELDESSTNVMIGKSAMYYGKNTECVAIGLNALKGGADTAANGVLAIGTGAGYSGGGTSNVFVGKEAGYKNTGNLNTFVGQQAGVNATSWGCVAIGAQADTQGYSQSIAIGRQAKATKSTQAVFGSDAITETLLKGNLVVRGTDGVMRQIVFNEDGTCRWTVV